MAHPPQRLFQGPFQLRLLGGAILTDATGTVVAEQRRRLALLAILAIGGVRGISRDKVIAILSPDSETDSARHALHQLLYYLRQQVSEDLFLGIDPLRLNPKVLSSDVADFDAHVANSDLEAAARTMRGPFLDGFHLPDSQEFEQWAGLERARLSHAYANVIHALAARAEDARDSRMAVEWWREAVRIDPLSARSAAGLIRALVESGDRPAALRYGQAYGALLRAELGTEPDAEVQKLLAEVVGGPAPEQTTPLVPAELGLPVEEVPTDAGPSRAELRRRQAGHAPRWQGTVAAAGFALAGIIVVALSAFLRGRTHPPEGSRVAVVPFASTVSDTSLLWLADGIVELLNARITETGGPATLEAHSTIDTWRRFGGGSTGESRRESVFDPLRKLGAARVVTGAILGRPGRVVLNAELHDAVTGASLFRAEVAGAPDSVGRLVDRLAVLLISAMSGETVPSARDASEIPTAASLAYLRGRAAVRREDWSGAVEAFLHALQVDSSFAPAAVQLATASGHMDGMHVDRAEGLAWRHRGELSAKERTLLVAQLGLHYPEWHPLAEQVRAWRAIVASDWTSADAWDRLGYLYMRHGARIGVPEPLHEARLALERAIALDPRRTVTRSALVDLAAFAGDTALLARALRTDRPASPPLERWNRWLTAFTRRDSAALSSLRAELSELGRGERRAAVITALQAAFALSEAEALIGGLEADARTGIELAEDASLRYFLALNQGRPAGAQRMAGALAPEWRPLSRQSIIALAALYGDGDRAAGDAAGEALSAETIVALSLDAGERRSQKVDACVAEQWRLMRGNQGMTRLALERLHSPETDTPRWAKSFYATCSAVIRAWAATNERRPDARALLERADSMIMAGQAWHWALPDHRIMARLWHEQGDVHRALAAIRRRRFGGTGYFAADAREEGVLALAVGDSAAARRSFGIYLAHRAAPEPALRFERDEIRELVAGLGASR